MLKEFKAKEFGAIRKLDGISEQTMADHYKLYLAYVKKANEILNKLHTPEFDAANATYSSLRSLKTELSFAIGGVRNHEVYFDHLGGKGGEPTGWLKEALLKNFGSIEGWQKDLKATALAARGWAWLIYDWETGQLYNHLGDSQNTYGFWYGTPLVALDMYEHAFWRDFGTDKAGYIEAFFRNLDWNKVQETVEELELDQS